MSEVQVFENKPHESYSWTEPPKVVAVAVIGYDLLVYSMLPPNRHHDLLRYMGTCLQHPWPVGSGSIDDDGFVLSNGAYATREQAKVFAEYHGQLLPTASESPSLFSEDLW
jgi:hypothetical protein